MDAHQALHPTDQTLSSFGLGKLDDASAEAVNKHLEQCPDCRQAGRRDAGRQLPRAGSRGAQGADRSMSGQSQPGGPQNATSAAPWHHPRRSARCLRAWPTIPTTRSSASWAAAAWASSTWPRTSSWDGKEVLKVVSGH